MGDGTFGIAANTEGPDRLCSRDLSGETHFSYDPRARIDWEVKRIPDRAHGGLVSFRTRFAYDSSDRLTLLTYPDGDELTHTYNARNLLQRLHGASSGDVVRSIRYALPANCGPIALRQRGDDILRYDPRLLS